MPIMKDLKLVSNDNAPRDDDEQKQAPGPSEKKTTPGAFDKHWVSLGDCPNVLIDKPAPQKWLIKRWTDNRGVGVFPCGKTGLLVGAGGISKSTLVTQAAVTIAGGGFLLDTFRVDTPGHVLLALAEEELDECTRRLWRACNALELSADQRKDIAQRLHVLPLHGVQVAMLESPTPNKYTVTDVARDLKKAMAARAVDWSAVILDPLSRWSGGGAERDNQAATNFVQIVEDLTKVRGNPSGLLVHHSSQASIQSGESAARGVSGLHDGLRWQASMDLVKHKDGSRAVKLSNKKSNYSPEFDDLLLIRNSEPGIEGTLRLANELEREKFGVTEDGREKAKQAKAKTAFEANCDLVLARLPVAPSSTTMGAIEGALRSAGTPLSDKTLKLILEHLSCADGGNRAQDLSSGSRGAARAWARTCEVSS